MHCRNCGYDLRGLDACGRCPECGLDVWASVVHSVDPASSRLPSLRNPVAVGNSLLVLTACMFIGALLVVLPTVSATIEDAQPAAGARGWWTRLPSMDWRFAAMLLLAVAWGVWTLAPPRGSEPHGPVWDDIWRLGVGYAGWLACATMFANISDPLALSDRQPRLVLALAGGAFALIGLFGLRGVFSIIGQRSREYRRMQGGRQSVELIMVAVGGVMMGTLIAHAARFGLAPQSWNFGVRTMGRAVQAMSMFMLLIGLAYLVVNAWAIRGAIRKPPPALDEVLLPRMPNDTWIPDRED
jgi:hypothetical protein